ncbi:hypothetical protein C6H55_19080 [Vibrio cholerae]|nr:hypothetical protein [Vibrio cholerae]MCD1171454.1 hypothetical protein [Vibrio cholerae]
MKRQCIWRCNFRVIASLVFLSLREVSLALSSRFEQFGAFIYRLKVCRQLSIVFRCLMKQ